MNIAIITAEESTPAAPAPVEKAPAPVEKAPAKASKVAAAKA